MFIDWKAPAALGLALLLAGCASSPTHPSLASGALPELVPVRSFVASREATGAYRVSPDGRKLAWGGTSGLTGAIRVKTIGQSEERAFPMRARRFVWSGDSRFIVAMADPSGNEDTQVYVVPADRPDASFVNRTPFAGTKVGLTRVIEGSADVIVETNQRDRKVFDPYRLNLETGRLDRLAINPGSVGWWGADSTGRLRARLLLEGDQSRLQLPGPTPEAAWRTAFSWSRFESVRFLDFADEQTVWALSNRGRDRLELVKLRLDTGEETPVFAVPDVDLDNVLLGKQSRAPLMAYAMPGYPRVDVFDESLKQRLAVLKDDQPAEIAVTSKDDSDRVMTVAVTSDRGTRYHLLNADGGAPVFLGETRLSLISAALTSTQPIDFISRDGLKIHGYLTLPKGVAPRNLPMVLLVHGGPWARDRWGDEGAARTLQQFLANRGYAVLQVNYRGSTGYGRAFMEKAIGEFAGRMHDDLIDGVRWAVARGVADPERVAIYGASYGGYSALVGATFTPETFACAIDVVGVSDLARLVETAPPYWGLGLAWWRRYVGDPANPEQRRLMDAKSPVYRADQVQKPILIMHGVNDPRVKLEQSERMVDALRKAGKNVEFVTFKGDGHGNQRWPNNLTMYRHTEDFLAKCLGGRTSGFDYYQLGAWAF
ncbi:S9 family peptidase [Variovorax sp. PAMC 28711]|uniref:S9 family peptidase n=1 Tax=Variovorax sp. PAMC 28711 TaxID=1795631 RepID=UPI00078ED8B8|nr:S9 family peptidase [Variovorax sp. PAMC 28711]AMM25591.1 hypothetical protein AX767_15415 [Variovorax sp. PAMC 28711]